MQIFQQSQRQLNFSRHAPDLTTDWHSARQTNALAPDPLRFKPSSDFDHIPLLPPPHPVIVTEWARAAPKRFGMMLYPPPWIFLVFSYPFSQCVYSQMVP